MVIVLLRALLIWAQTCTDSVARACRLVMPATVVFFVVKSVMFSLGRASPGFILAVVIACTSTMQTMLSFRIVRLLTASAARRRRRGSGNGIGNVNAQRGGSMRVNLLDAADMEAGMEAGGAGGAGGGKGKSKKPKPTRGASLGRLLLLAGPEKWLIICGTVSLVFSSAAQMVRRTREECHTTV